MQAVWTPDDPWVYTAACVYSASWPWIGYYLTQDKRRTILQWVHFGMSVTRGPFSIWSHLNRWSMLDSVRITEPFHQRGLTKIWAWISNYIDIFIWEVIVRRAGLLLSQQDFEWRWSVPLFQCLTVLEFSFILFDLCLLITFFNFIMNYVPIVTFWIFTYHKIWVLSIMFCFIWSYWIIYFLACL